LAELAAAAVTFYLPLGVCDSVSDLGAVSALNDFCGLLSVSRGCKFLRYRLLISFFPTLEMGVVGRLLECWCNGDYVVRLV